MNTSRQEMTALLQDVVDGGGEVPPMLWDAVYNQLHRLAAGVLRGERANHSLQPTALVNEAFVKLIGGNSPQLASRKHFFVIAARVMRRVLVDHARARKAQRRGGDEGQVKLNPETVGRERPAEILALEDQLAILDQIAPRRCRILELRFFAGLSPDEIARALDLSSATVFRELKAAKLWLYNRLRGT